MNDSLRTDVFVRYPPETIAVACIYLSARKLNVPLPKNPSWFDVLDVEEDDIKACCYRMICLYNRKKSNQDELEAIIDGLKKKMDEERRAQREYTNAQNTPNQSSPASRSGSPVRSNDEDQKDRQKENGSNNTTAGNNTHQDSRDEGSPKKKKHHKHKQRSRSRSRSYDDYHRGRSKKGSKSSKRGSPRSPSMSPPRKKKHGHHHKEKMRHRSRSRDRDNRGRGQRGGVASIGLYDDDYRGSRKRNRDYRH